MAQRMRLRHKGSRVRYNTVVLVRSDAMATLAIRRSRSSIILVASPRGILKRCLFYCPCLCGALLNIRVGDHESQWLAHLDARGRLTLSPSIWLDAGCRAHF